MWKPPRQAAWSCRACDVRKGDSLEGRIVRWIFFGCALISILTTLGIIFTLVSQAIGFFVEVSVWDFLTGTRWTPILKPRAYGVLPLVGGTLLIAAIAAMVALPVGLAAAIFLSEYAPNKVRRIVKPVLEILAGIPTVVYGYFALTFVTPLLQILFPEMLVFNALSAGIVMGVMIIPMVSSLSEDAMNSVPNSLRNAAYALGATRVEVSLRGGSACCAVRHRRVFHYCHISRHWRNDARYHRCRRDAEPNAQSTRKHTDDDRIHRAAQPRRNAARLT